ncbi:hypothetical protein GCM10009798_06520 [Nocardioides panacihumi]|uniref:DUF389 domain-containing protein n=1 Tax=Nocardioides panacihumi TaxID=400774 RepID=A0ABP5BS78_9ACTN
MGGRIDLFGDRIELLRWFGFELKVIPLVDIARADVGRRGLSFRLDDDVERLHGTGVHLAGTIHIQPVATWLSRAGLVAERRRYSLLWFATRSLVLGFGAAIVVVTLLALLGRALGWVTLAQVTAPRPQTAFVYSPDKWSLIVAVVAAAAGVLSLTSAKVGGLSGVFISVTTVPAPGNVALGLAFGVGHEIWGSLAQLVVNVVGMAVAGWVTLAFQQTVWSRMSLRRARFSRRLNPRS